MLITSLVAKSLAAKIALGFVGVSVGATAVAAQAGALPAPVQQVAYDVAGAVGVPAPQQPVTRSTPPEPMRSAVPVVGVTTPTRRPEPSAHPEAHESEPPHPEAHESESPHPEVDASGSHQPDCHSGKTDCEDHGHDSEAPKSGEASHQPESETHQPGSESHKSGKESHKPEPKSPTSGNSHSDSRGGSGHQG
jgi:hypothetical protein